ncbi:hypothetical protein Tco_0682595 [Tanacetum coccineum]|uniref:Uncharacterized protein n=1 Tax=Tanacetum coccineum TaxID=301880 RepID=A0ABQ4XSN2_9ASTR
MQDLNCAFDTWLACTTRLGSFQLNVKSSKSIGELKEEVFGINQKSTVINKDELVERSSGKAYKDSNYAGDLDDEEEYICLPKREHIAAAIVVHVSAFGRRILMPGWS